MSNNSTVIPYFQPGHGPTPNAGRKHGTRNRATVIREVLSVVSPCDMLDNTVAHVTQEMAIAVAMVREARNGSVQAANFIYDSAYGKMANVQINETDRPAIDYTQFSPEQLLEMRRIITNPARRTVEIETAQEVGPEPLKVYVNPEDPDDLG